VIAEFEKYRDNKMFYVYQNFDRNTFVNVMRNASLQIGNSSAGVCESASVPIPAVNVGSRNGGRAAQENVLFTGGGQEEIAEAIDKALSPGFAEKIAGMKNLYGDGESSRRAYELIKRIDYSKIVLKKEDPLKG